MSGVAAQGALESMELGPDGDLYTAHVVIRAATRELSARQPVVLRKSIHGGVSPSLVGSDCRIIDARTKPDGRLRADISTVFSSLPDLPLLGNAIEPSLSAI